MSYNLYNTAVLDFKKELLCDKCSNDHLCKFKEQFEETRNKLIELSSTKKVEYPLVTPGLTDESILEETPSQDLPPEINLTNGIYLTITCCNYQPAVKYRPDISDTSIIPPFRT